MSNVSKFYLTGGVFFFLLKTSALKRQSSRDRIAGKKESHTDAQIMNDFIKIFTDIEFGCSRKDVSQYIHGNINGSAGIPLNDTAQIESMLKRIENKYYDVIKEMKNFIVNHINQSKKEFLVSIIIYIIENDNEIPEEQEFFINPDGYSMTKADIRKENNFCLDSFLVGVFRYIEENRSMENYKGKDTLDLISEKKTKSGLRTYNPENIQDKLREINVIFEESDIEKNESENISDSKNNDITVSQKKLSDAPRDGKYYKRLEQFHDAVKNLISDTESSDMEIYYKSSELGKRYVDINDYIRKKGLDVVNLDSETVTEFKERVIYKYTGMCSFKCDNNKIISSITYNGEKISSFTSERNWINQSMLDLYVSENKSRCCVCYFIFDQCNVFKFLQIGDVEN